MIRSVNFFGGSRECRPGLTSMRDHRAGDQAESSDDQNQHDDRVEQTGWLKVDVQIGNHACQNKQKAAGREYPPDNASPIPEHQTDSN